MTADPPLPRTLQIEVTGACNLRCRMCLVRYRPPLGRLEGSIPLATFREVVATLPDLDEVTLQGLGEPLLAPDLPLMIAELRERGVRVGFNTNATLLDERWAARLVELAPTWVHVSLDGATPATYEGIRDGADFASVAANVRRLAERVRRGGRDEPRLTLVMVAMRRNVAEVAGLVRLAAAWGVPRVWVQNLSHGFDDAGDAEAFQAIRDFTAAEALWPDGAGDRAAVERAFAAGRVAAHDTGVQLRLPRLDDGRARRAPGTPGCDWPWRGAYVRHDGAVQPCCMLMGEERGILGNLRRQTFADVWHGPRYREFRAALLTDTPPPECRGCAAWRGVF